MNFNALIDWLIYYCLTSSKQYFIYIQDGAWDMQGSSVGRELGTVTNFALNFVKHSVYIFIANLFCRQNY
jgi:hypothetical protein